MGLAVVHGRLIIESAQVYKSSLPCRNKDTACSTSTRATHACAHSFQVSRPLPAPPRLSSARDSMALSPPSDPESASPSPQDPSNPQINPPNTPPTTLTTTLTATLTTKRKPSKRANTAERRATHNAVERQRRETLNGRFLVCLSPFFHLSIWFSYSPRIWLLSFPTCPRSVALPSPLSSILLLPTFTLPAATE